jgi:ribosome-associated protein
MTPFQIMSAKTKSSPSTGRIVAIRAEPIELSQFLKFSGCAESGGQAKQAVVDGEVAVNGVVETRKGRKLIAGDKVVFGGETLIVQLG